MQKRPEAIPDGEPPYDIYVRWKQIHEQPIGWKPDPNDGVWLNIRPVANASLLRSRVTVHWTKAWGLHADGGGR